MICERLRRIARKIPGCLLCHQAIVLVVTKGLLPVRRRGGKRALLDTAVGVVGVGVRKAPRLQSILVRIIEIMCLQTELPFVVIRERCLELLICRESALVVFHDRHEPSVRIVAVQGIFADRMISKPVHLSARGVLVGVDDRANGRGRITHLDQLLEIVVDVVHHKAVAVGNGDQLAVFLVVGVSGERVASYGGGGGVTEEVVREGISRAVRGDGTELTLCVLRWLRLVRM